MSYRQLKTVRKDHTGGAGNDALDDSSVIPANVAWQEVQYSIRNEGTASAYIIVSDDIGNEENTAHEIPSGGFRAVGPYNPQYVPILRSLSGANCVITPVVFVG